MSTQFRRWVSLQPIGPRSVAFPEERCPSTGKRSFATEAECERALIEWARRTSFQGYPYECREPDCGAWHVTRHEPETRTEGEQEA